MKLQRDDKKLSTKWLGNIGIWDLFGSIGIYWDLVFSKGVR